MKLIIMRGLPGCGKSTYAKKTFGYAAIFSTDDYFIVNGKYQYNPREIGKAHAWNQKRAINAMFNKYDVVIDNTCCQLWEMDIYLTVANNLNYEIEIVDMFDGGYSDDELAKRNNHGVPKEKIAMMRASFER